MSSAAEKEDGPGRRARRPRRVEADDVTLSQFQCSVMHIWGESDHEFEWLGLI